MRLILNLKNIVQIIRGGTMNNGDYVYYRVLELLITDIILINMNNGINLSPKNNCKMILKKKKNPILNHETLSWNKCTSLMCNKLNWKFDKSLKLST
jgi:hypothetical protein